MQLLRSWPSGKGWLISLLSTLDGLVWRHLTNAPAFSASCLPNVPKKLSKTLKRPHLVLVRTRYQVPTKSGRSFPLRRRSVYLLFPFRWSGARESPQKLQRFLRTVTKKEYGLFGAKPLIKPPPGSASGTRNSSCPICDGMDLPPAAGGDGVVQTHTISEEYAQRILLDRWNSFFRFVVV